jgi:DNA repair ATPase RecN
MQNFLNDIQAHMNEISGLISAFQTSVNELNARAEKLKPTADQFEATSKALVEKLAELAKAEKRLAEIKVLHAKFHQAATSV